MIVPISVNASNLVENTYKDSISQTVEEVKNIKELTEEINDE